VAKEIDSICHLVEALIPMVEIYREADFCFLFFFSILGFELRAHTLNHSTSPIFVKGFSIWRGVSQNYLPGLASNRDPPDLCLLSS
jgi:hypothetical protein